MLDVKEITQRVQQDPGGFVAECEAEYCGKVQAAADRIANAISNHCVVLLSGPSGSGKTTTALKLQRKLEELGVGTRSVSLDNYYKTVDPETAPRTEDGQVDYESPECLDIPLLKEHIKKIITGQEVLVPKFNFAKQSRSKSSSPLCLGKNEIVIFEGIHALNDMITQAAGNHGIKLYISSRSDFLMEGSLQFKGTWTRLVRRIVRDERFRGTKAAFTLEIWESIRRGEKKYISPFKNRADIIINSTHSYELCMLKKHTQPLLAEIPKGISRYNEIVELSEKIRVFPDLDDMLVPPDSLMREFIGGGSFKY